MGYEVPTFQEQLREYRERQRRKEEQERKKHSTQARRGQNANQSGKREGLDKSRQEPERRNIVHTMQELSEQAAAQARRRESMEKSRQEPGRRPIVHTLQELNEREAVRARREQEASKIRRERAERNNLRVPRQQRDVREMEYMRELRDRVASGAKSKGLPALSGLLGLAGLGQFPLNLDFIQFMRDAVGIIDGVGRKLEEIDEIGIGKYSVETGLDKLDPMFRLAAYITAGIEVTRQEFDSSTHVPYRTQVDRMINTYRKRVCESGLSVTEVIKAASKFFEDLDNLLPKNIVFQPMKTFAGLVGRSLELVSEKFENALREKVVIFDHNIQRGPHLLGTARNNPPRRNNLNNNVPRNSNNKKTRDSFSLKLER